MDSVHIRIDNRVRVDTTGLEDVVTNALKESFDHSNPEFHKRQHMGFATWNIPREIRTWNESNSWNTKALDFPRGGAARVREVLDRYGLDRVYEDARCLGASLTNEIPDHKVELWDHQKELVDAAVKLENCILKAPTGSGKTTVAFAIAARLKLPTLVIVSTAALFKQWVTRAEKELGIRKRDLGIIRAGKRKLGVLTIAMQRSLAVGGIDGDLARYFGCVIADECFESHTPVLMADGTHKHIEDIVEGDEVALGGRVLGVGSRWYEGKLSTCGGSLVTPEHPVWTERGWVPTKSVCSEDNLRHDPLHEVRRLQQTSSRTKPAGEMSFPWDGNVRQADGRVSVMREAGSGEEARVSRLDEVRNSGALEQRQDVRGLAFGSSGRREAQGASAHYGKQDVPSALARSEEARAVDQEHVCRAAQTIREGRGTKGVKGAYVGAHQRGEDEGVRGQDTWQRRDPHFLGAGTVEGAAPTGLQKRTGREDRAADADLLRIGLRARGDEVGVGDRREQSPAEGEEGIRRAEGCISQDAWVDSKALPGDVRLERHRGLVRALDGVVGSLRVHNLQTERGVYVAAGVLVHNCQLFAAKTFIETIDPFPAKYRIGISADHRRKDRKEFLIHDLFGSVAAEVKRRDLIDVGVIVDTLIRVVPTNFEAPWYGKPDDEHPATFEQLLDDRKSTFDPSEIAKELDWDRLLEEMANDEDRQRLAAWCVKDGLREDSQVLVMSHRRDHCRALDQEFVRMGLTTGFLIGGADYQREFDAVRTRFEKEDLQVAIGTFQAIGYGIDLPKASVVVCVTPIASNQFFFNQVRGRVCRKAKGKTGSTMFYLWDEKLYGDKHLRNLLRWNGHVVVWVGGKWIGAKEYLRDKRDKAKATEGTET